MIFKLTESKNDIISLIDFVGKDVADDFLKYKGRLQPPENDLYYWIKKGDKRLLIDRIAELKSAPTAKQRRETASSGAQKLYDDGKWLVLKINTPEAARIYGKGTQWCITGHDDYDFNSHAEDADIYFFINKSQGYGGKYTLEIFHDNGDWSLWHSDDVCIPCIKDAPHVSGLPDISKPHPRFVQNLRSRIGDEQIQHINMYLGEFIYGDQCGFLIKTDKDYYMVCCEAMSDSFLFDDCMDDLISYYGDEETGIQEVLNDSYLIY
jgi:hypothetical protein